MDLPRPCERKFRAASMPTSKQSSFGNFKNGRVEHNFSKSIASETATLSESRQTLGHTDQSNMAFSSNKSQGHALTPHKSPLLDSYMFERVDQVTQQDSNQMQVPQKFQAKKPGLSF